MHRAPLLRSAAVGLLALVLCEGCAEDEAEPYLAPSHHPLAPSTPSKGLAPLTGGTLLMLRNGHAVVSDPDLGSVTFVDLFRYRVRGVVAMPEGSRPTRAIEDGAGNVRVVLRGTGQIATITAPTVKLASIDWVCAEPRGLTWDEGHKQTVVACASGELVTLPEVGKASTVQVGAELRDVLVDRDGVRASTFRSAQLLSIDTDGRALPLGRPPRVPFGRFQGVPVAFEPGVAWRTLALPGGGLAMVHQRSVDGDVRAPTELAGPDLVRDTFITYEPRVVPGAGYYGTDLVVMDPKTNVVERTICTTGVVRSAVTVFNPDGTVRGSKELVGILPIDAALAPNGHELAVTAAGNHQLVRVDLDQVTTTEGRACGPVQPATPRPDDDLIGQPTGVAFAPNGLLVVHSRQPARLLMFTPDERLWAVIDLPKNGAFARTPGHTLFHTATKAVACASCHPEGGEDGQVWNFLGTHRRTQPLTGGLAHTAPYHWGGQLQGMTEVVSDTFVGRMGGKRPSSAAVEDLVAFLDELPAPRAPPSPATSARLAEGAQVFEQAGCGSCHSGTMLTNNATVDVGTGGLFQVPSLKGLRARRPYMHAGCAVTLRERFTNVDCGGAHHGDLSRVTGDKLDALVDYLQTL